MKWKDKDDAVGWCCIAVRRDSDAVDRERTAKAEQEEKELEGARETTMATRLRRRSKADDDIDVEELSPEKSQTPPTSMETRPESKENLVSSNNGTPRSTTASFKQANSRLNRSLSRNKDEQESNIIRSNTGSNLIEQSKAEELASGLATMGLLNDEDMNKLNTTFESVSSASDSIERNSAKQESYKMQKQSYQSAKKRITSELANVLKDSSVVIVSDWLKVRGTLRDWTKLWAILKPGLMLLYRSPPSKNGVWVGTVVLSSCEVMQRPSKKPGFCFKIWHPLEKSIWAQKGPNNEQFGAITFPLPMNYLICRASDETAGRCWMDALELTMKCSKLLKKPYSSSSVTNDETANNTITIPSNTSVSTSSSGGGGNAPSGDQTFLNVSFSDTDYDLTRLTAKEVDDDRMSDASVDVSKASRSGSSHSESSQDLLNDEDNETPYIAAAPEELGELGNAAQTEEVAEENKSLIMHLLKQVRPGMDLSKVVLPTFILEPRSFLEKLSDYYHHCDILEEAVNSPDPLVRMKTIVKFYLSGFYKKPKGLKKPYNPVLGEVYRCFFHHTKTESKTFYMAEQISHHPPITNFYVTNRKEGFAVQGSILARSKFYGNSLSAILDGTARLTLLNRGEDYIITMPYANCKGILIGKLTMELGGKVTIVCEKTRYSADIEFKLKPFIGGQELTNHIEGKIRLEKDVIYTFSGHWDDEITIVDKATNTKSLFWKVNQSVVNSRLKRFVVPIEQQQDNESEKLWQRVTTAIKQNDQISATEEKTIIEDEQRKQIKERKATGVEWHPRLFKIDPNSKEWIYIFADARPWDAHNDISTYESNFIICTRTRHRSHQMNSSHHPEPLRQTSTLARGPSPSLNNIPIEENRTENAESSNETTVYINPNDDLTAILKRLETSLNRTNERIEIYEQHLKSLKVNQAKLLENQFYSFSPYLQILLIILVAIILKYI